MMKKLFYTLLLASAVVSLSISPVLAGGEGCGGGKCDKSKKEEKTEGTEGDKASTWNLGSCECDKSKKEEKKEEGEKKP
jgi:hypothetical protein